MAAPHGPLPPISPRTGRQEDRAPISHSRGDRRSGRGTSGRKEERAATKEAEADRAPKGRPGPGKRTTQSGDASLTDGH